MSKLNKVAKKWVKALRSGKIKQTKGQLGRESGSRCCLGVLCDLTEDNDVGKRSFAQIADTIESMPEGMFA